MASNAAPFPAHEHGAPALKRPALRLEPPPGIALLDGDPDFAHGIDPDELPVARRLVVVPRVNVEPGRWSVPDAPPGAAPFAGAVVLDGVLLRDVGLGTRVSTQIVGPGDVVDPWAPAGDGLPCAVRWSAHGGQVSLAVLDARFAVAARRWPSLATVVQRKLAERADRLAGHAAALHLPGVEHRIVAVLWQLAERFGRVRNDGVLVPLPLTHQLIGQLVGAQRPTVSLALKHLSGAGHVTRTGDAGWLLDAASRALLSPAAR